MTRLSHPFARRSAFLQYATLAYATVVLVASVYPLAGWHLPDAGTLWIQLSEWPRYYTYTDVVLNVLGYVPLGMLLTLWLRQSAPPMRAAGIALVLCILACTVLEILQGGIPSRVPSGLDVFCNSVGGLLGAWLALLAGEGVLATHSPVKRWRDATVLEGEAGDATVVLILVWLLVQFRPDLWLFSTFDVRAWLGEPLSRYSARWYQALEAAVAASGLLVLAGLIAVAALERQARWFLVVVVAALAVRSFATFHFHDPGALLSWLTPGNAAGVVAGVVAGLVAVRLDPRHAAVLAIVALIVGATLVNLAPPNPYLDPPGGPAWQQSHLRSIAGTTRVLGIAWPFATMLALLAGVRQAAAR